MLEIGKFVPRTSDLVTPDSPKRILCPLPTKPTNQRNLKNGGPIAHLNPDDESFAKSGNQGEVRKLIKGAHTIMSNVPEGHYP